MKIEAFLEKAEIREINIIRKLILEGGTVNYNDMIEFLAITRASLDKDLNMIASRFKSNEAKAQIIFDGQIIQLEMDARYSFEQIYQLYLQGSVKAEIINYLYRYQEFSVLQLSQKLSISESSLFRRIKDLNTHLKEFQIKIRNGRMQGEELQIRYFYYQFYWSVAHKKALKTHGNDGQITNMIQGLENFLNISFGEEAKQRIAIWFQISKNRIKVADKVYKNLRKQMKPYLEDDLYQKIRIIVLRYFSRYSIEFDEEEAMLHFVFLLSFPILSEDDFHEYKLLRNRRAPTAYLDTYIAEVIIIHYEVKKLPYMIERELFYYLSQIHTKLYFLQGNIEVYDDDELFKKMKNFAGKELVSFAYQLRDISLKEFKIENSSNTPFLRMILLRYISLLNFISYNTMNTLQIGIDLMSDSITAETLNRMLILKMKHINGIHIEEYQMNKEYDLILTNNLQSSQNDYGNAEIYLLSEMLSTFDVKNIEALIKQLNQ
jgi:hypothetical protein